MPYTMDVLAAGGARYLVTLRRVGRSLQCRFPNFRPVLDIHVYGLLTFYLLIAYNFASIFISDTVTMRVWASILAIAAAVVSSSACESAQSLIAAAEGFRACTYKGM